METVIVSGDSQCIKHGITMWYAKLPLSPDWSPLSDFRHHTFARRLRTLRGEITERRKLRQNSLDKIVFEYNIDILFHISK